MLRVTAPIMLVAIFLPGICAAQTPAQTDRSRWGVSASFTPNWRVPEDVGKNLFEEAPIDISGSEFKIGVVRGRDFGGDWGVSFVRRTVKDGSTLGTSSENCFGIFGCGLQGRTYVYRDVRLTGVEVHKFVPFVTIKQRAQIGMNFAGGVGRFEGTADEYRYNPFVTDSRGRILSATNRQPVVIAGIEAKSLFIVQPVPLGKVEISVAGIVAPGFKVRVSGGFSFPSYPAVNVTGIYLIGRR